MQLMVSNIDELDVIACKLSKNLKVKDTVLLDGELGSGKTEFVRRIASHLGVADDITSPTFCFVNTYDTDRDFKLYHFDIYRLDSEDGLAEIGFDDCGYNPRDGVSFIEWSKKFSDCMPKDALQFEFSGQGDQPRKINISAEGTRSKQLLEVLKNA